MWIHLVARCTGNHRPFEDFEIAGQAWRTLKKCFPDALAAVLMPNHLHIILPLMPQGIAVNKLAGVLGAISKKTRISKLWQPISEPSNIPDRHHLRRQVRYVFLNPCRKSLCKDPLEWVWSSYRDVMGGTAYPWQGPARVSQILYGPEADLRVRLHAYVSADPSVAVDGTSPPTRPAPSSVVSDFALTEIHAAAASALQCRPDAVRRTHSLRNLFIHLAFDQGWDRVTLLAQICDVHPATVWRIRRGSISKGLSAAKVCLGDQRFFRMLRNIAKTLHPGQGLAKIAPLRSDSPNPW